MATHEISVTVEKDSIRVVPDTLTMTSVDEVHWAGTTPRKFSIVFDGQGPFGSKELAHAVVANKHRPRVRGRFKYSVVSGETPGLRLDPIIVVEEPPTNP